MATFASRIGDLIPEGNIKNNLRLAAFKLLFTTAGSKRVELGTKQDKVYATIGRLIFARESLGEREIEGYLQHYRVKPGDTIVNAGAYHGYFALYLSKKVGPTGQVICFEPEPNNIHLLRQNLANNKTQNVAVIEKGLWNKNTKLPLISMGSGSQFAPRSSWRGQTIQACTLDSELEKLGIKHVDLVTMDIEGAELEAIQGCQKTIANNPNIHFAIASYHERNGKQTYHQLEKYLHQHGLQAKTEFPRHLTTYAYAKK